MNSVRLLPVPRQLELGGEGAAADASVEVRRDSSLPAQGYSLSASRDGFRIEHADAPGLRYAHEALAQIRSQAGAALPGFRIRD